MFSLAMRLSHKALPSEAVPVAVWHRVVVNKKGLWGRFDVPG